MKWIGITLILAGFALVPAAPSVVELKSPAAPGSEAPNLSITPDGKALLSWLEPVSPKGHALRFSRREAQGWASPRTITSGASWFVSGADFPVVAFLADGTMVANTLIATNMDREAYNTNILVSRDAGSTWSKPISLHKDRKERQHGFVSFVPSPEGKLGAIWLDGRQLDNDGFGDMRLMYAAIDKSGTVGPEAVLDGRVCECCQTAMAAVPNGLLVVYRDRSAKEIRDVSIARYANGKWSKAEPLTTDGWEIDGCPVNGPAISANGRNVAVAWFSAPNDKARVNVVLSTDAGKTFGKPIKIDDGNTSGGVDVASLPSGGAVVSWVERASRGNQVRIRIIEANGVAGTAVNASAAGLQPGSFPRIKLIGKDLIVAWTASGDKTTIHTAVVNLQ